MLLYIVLSPLANSVIMTLFHHGSNRGSFVKSDYASTFTPLAHILGTRALILVFAQFPQFTLTAPPCNGIQPLSTC